MVHYILTSCTIQMDVKINGDEETVSCIYVFLDSVAVQDTYKNNRYVFKWSFLYFSLPGLELSGTFKIPPASPSSPSLSFSIG